MKHLLKRVDWQSPPTRGLKQLYEFYSVDIVLPMISRRETWLQRISTLEEGQKKILYRLRVQ